MTNNQNEEQQVPMTIDNDENSDSGSDSDSSCSSCARNRKNSGKSNSAASEFRKLESAVSESSESELSDSADSSAAVDRQFRVFAANGMEKLDESSPDYQTVKTKFVIGMGSAGGGATVEAIHKNMCTDNPSMKSRFVAFKISGEAVAKKHGGNPNFKESNIRDGWYGASKEEIAEVLAHGFSGLRAPKHHQQSNGVGLHFSAQRFASDGALLSSEDETGLKHILLCRVILGKVEVVLPGSKQSCPSSKEVDSGVDNLINPRKYIVWNAFMNTRILPAFAISFKCPPLLHPTQPKQQIPSGVQTKQQAPSVVHTKMQIALRAKTKQKIAAGVKTRQQVPLGAKTKQRIAFGTKSRQQIVSGAITKLQIALGVRLLLMIVSGIRIPTVSFGAVVLTLGRHLTRLQMRELATLYMQFRRNKITCQQLVQMMRQIVGDDRLFTHVIQSCSGKVVRPGKPMR